MSSVPMAAQGNLIVSSGRVWWGNRSLVSIPSDPPQPEELCCDATVQIQNTEQYECVIKQFWQSMASLGGTRDFYIKNPISEVHQPGWQRFLKDVDTTETVRFQQPFYQQGLWDEEASIIEAEKQGKRSDDLLVIYFYDYEFISESSIIKHLGHDFIVTNVVLEYFAGARFYRVTCEVNYDSSLFGTYQLNPTRIELEGRIFVTNGLTLGDIDNTYIADPDNAQVRVFNNAGTTELFQFGEDLSGFPPDSSYINPENPKWFWPTEFEVNPVAREIRVKDQKWQEYIYFNFDGIALRSIPIVRRR